MLAKIQFFLLQVFRYFPIFLIKKPFGYKVPFHAMMPVVGYFHLAVEKRVHRQLWPLLGIFLYGIVLSIFYGHYVGIARCLQAIGLILMSDYMLSKFKLEDFIKVSRAMLILSLVYLLFEYMILGIPHYKVILPGIKIFRFNGLVGESNFSAICIALAMLLTLLYDKKKYFVFLGLISLILFASRIAFILFILGALGLLINRFAKKLGKWLVILFASIPFLFPLFIWTIESFFSDRIKLLVEKIVNGRYVINACFLKMFFDNPLGVGYFRGRSMYKHYGKKGSTLIENGLFRYAGDFAWTEYEHHNLFMQTLSELGIIGYSLLAYFIYQLIKRYDERHFLAFYIFSLTFVGFSSLNGYNEFILYFMIAFLLSNIKASEQSNVA